MELWEHQVQTKTFLSTRDRANDFSDPGTGKTRAQVEHYIERKHPGRCLVLCPKTLMYSAWGTEIDKFGGGAGYALAYAENRAEAFDMGTEIVIVNSDGVKWIADNERVLKNFDHLIVDESSAYKHAQSDRSKALKYISNKFKHRYMMSGTPNPLSVTELWHPMLCLDGGQRLGKSFFQFRNSVQVPTQVGPNANHLRWDDREGVADVVFELIRDVTIRFPFDEVMQHIPPNHRDTKPFQLSKKCQAIYDRLAADAIVALKDHVLTAVHAAALRTKLLQVASGAVYVNGEEDKPYEVIDRKRYELIADIVTERDHSVTFFNWKHQREELKSEFDRAKVDYRVIDGDTPQRERDNIVRRYQAGDYQTVLLHPRTGAHGLTLTRGTTTILASPIYEADLLKQAIHRIYRGGQTEVTNTILIEAQDTVEAKVYARLDHNTAQMDDLLSLLSR